MSDAFIPQLDASTFSSQVFWFSFCFFVFYLFVRRFYVPRVERSLKSREDHIVANFNDAKEKENRSSEIMKKCDLEISKAQALSEEHVQRVLLQTDNDIDAYLHRLENEKITEIKLEKERFVRSLRSDKSKIVANSVGLLKKIYNLTVISEISITDDEIKNLIEEEYTKEIDLLLNKTRLG